MSQHTTITSKIHKTLTVVAVTLLLAMPLAAPALVSADSDTADAANTSHDKTTASYDSSGYRAFPEKKNRSADVQNSSASSTSYSSADDGMTQSNPTDRSWTKDKKYLSRSDGEPDKKQDVPKKDDDFVDKKPGKEKQPENPGEAKPEVPVKPVEKVEKIETTEIIQKPAEVRQEVSQNVNQETNVIVQRETIERPVVHEKVVREVVKQPVVREKPVVHKPVVAATAVEPKPVVVAPKEEGKGELMETGADAKTSMLTGLGLLGAVSALGMISRRKALARR